MDPLDHIAELRRQLDEQTGREHDHHGPQPCWCGGQPQDKTMQSHQPREEAS